MPRKVLKNPNEERPKYMDEAGNIDLEKIFSFQPAQRELLRLNYRDEGFYLEAAAPQCLSIGGFRSGKTAGALMFGVMHYCLKWRGCDMLVLRRTFPELESGAIHDFKTFVPKELYSYDQSKHIATFYNGSRVVFGHCQNNTMRDIDKYLGLSFPFILIDECGQFSSSAWTMLSARNMVNAGCQPDEHGALPTPVIWGCTNPLGPYYDFYRTLFVEKAPWDPPEGSRCDKNGMWWVFESGVWRNIYNPNDHASQRTTVLDNPIFLERNPEYLAGLNKLPKALRDKYLRGLDGPAEGQYFDCFDPVDNVINLREDPEAIIWEMHQPVWIGQDWGMQHANAVYFFTKALVREVLGSNNYKLKTVCFREIVTTGGKTYPELVALIKHFSKLPNGTPVKVKSIHFSHEKFARQMTAHSPADDYTRALIASGLPPVTRATMDRIGSASLMYNEFKMGTLVITDNCRDIISTLPGLMRDPDQLDDVLKTDSKGDDCYDAFRYGLYGQLSARKRPAIDDIMEHAKKLDPLAAWFYKQRALSEIGKTNAPFRQAEQPVWQSKMENQ